MWFTYATLIIFLLSSAKMEDEMKVSFPLSVPVPRKSTCNILCILKGFFDTQAVKNETIYMCFPETVFVFRPRLCLRDCSGCV